MRDDRLSDEELNAMVTRIVDSQVMPVGHALALLVLAPVLMLILLWFFQ